MPACVAAFDSPLPKTLQLTAPTVPLFSPQLAPRRQLVGAFGSCPSRLQALQALFFLSCHSLARLFFRAPGVSPLGASPRFRIASGCKGALPLRDCNFSLGRVRVPRAARLFVVVSQRACARSGLLQQRLCSGARHDF